MSLVTLQIGQCGNQLGASLFGQLYQECADSGRMDAFFSPLEHTGGGGRPAASGSAAPQWQARCCLIDTEPKAVEQAERAALKQGGWRYDAGCRAVGKRGAGNNWSIGFHEHGQQMAEEIRRCARRAAESCDRLAGFLVLMSLAGGTGSGVGSFACDLLRDTYPNAFVLCVPVGPYSSGEVIVQNYNALLALARVTRACDAVLMVGNDGLHGICRQRMALDKVSLHDLNGVLAQQLSAALAPCDDRPVFRMADACAHLCPHPDYKLLQLYSLPQTAAARRDYSSYLWTGLTRHLCQMLRTGSVSEDGIDWSSAGGGASSSGALKSGSCLSVASLLVARGKGSGGIDTAEFRDPALYSGWASGPFQAWTCERACRSSDKTCSVLANSTACAAPLRTFARKAWHMYTAHAFVHQYTSHGSEESDFLEAFGNMEQVVANYESLEEQR